MNKIVGFVNTCYIDKDCGLVGYLKIDENTYINFNERTICSDQITILLSAAGMAVLEKLIIEFPKAVTYESLYQTYCGTSYSDKKPDIRAVRNVISGLRKYVRIINVRRFGYKIELPEKIKGFESIGR